MSSDNFKKYGFEKPEFECAILKKISQKDRKGLKEEYRDDVYVGYVKCDDGIIPVQWLDKGTCSESSFDLVPLKKEWYKDLNNKDKLVKFNGEFVVFLRYYQEQEVLRINFGGVDCYVRPDEVKIPTNKEIETLKIKE